MENRTVNYIKVNSSNRRIRIFRKLESAKKFLASNNYVATSMTDYMGCYNYTSWFYCNETAPQIDFAIVTIYYK